MNLRKACLYIESNSIGCNNYPFEDNPEGNGFKNLLYSFVYMKKAMKEMGFDISTKDINRPEDSEIVICWDNPHQLTCEKSEGKIWVLLIYDPPVYCPESWDPSYYSRFDFVFTFDETKVDNKKIFYYSFAIDTEYFSIPSAITKGEFNGRKLATIVSNAIQANPNKNYPDTTHYRRYDTIRWYGIHHQNDFRFYSGSFLNRNHYFEVRGFGVLRKLIPGNLLNKITRRIQRRLYRVFGGALGPLGKFDVIKKYKFYYCYENTVGINGYVSEKLFDCLYSGVVPIYWGAPNIKELIPFNCYINGFSFKNQEEVYEFINSMTYEEYCKYLNEAREFLNSGYMERFTVKSSVENILSVVSKSLKIS